MRVHRWIPFCLPWLAGSPGCRETGSPEEPAPLEAPAALDFQSWDPSFHRLQEVLLNGTWAFDRDPDGTGEVGGWHLPENVQRLQQTIEVPYPWGSALSGQGSRPPEGGSLQGGTEAIRRTWRGKAWYARRVEVPADWSPVGTSLVRFGAVDWRCRVFVDGVLAGSHEGGYDPFEIDVTRWARPGGSFHLVLEVEDRCDEDPASLTGKQGGAWYSCAGGIWQDVALSWRPDTWLSRIVQEPATAPGKVDLRGLVTGAPGPITVRLAWRCLDACPVPCAGQIGTSATLEPAPDGPGTGEVVLSLTLPPEDEWDPDSPCLATWRIEVSSASGTDRVEGYLGTRRLSRRSIPASGDRTLPPAADVLWINDRPLYVRAVLDQAWDPDGLLAAASLDRRRSDMRALLDAGFNAVRLHLKPEEPRVLALADSLGIGVIADLPSPPPTAGALPDAPWVPAWDRLWQAMLDRDRNHPSILWWTLFNEAWGLMDPPFWSGDEGIGFLRDRVARAREQDPTRPVEDNSATLTDGHVDSDLATWHFYSASIPFWKDLLDLLEGAMTYGGEGLRRGGGTWAGEPFLNTEFGGLGADDTRGDHGWLFHGILNVLRSSPSLSGYVFTEAYDVEWEHNGLRTFDRRPKDFGLDELGLSLRDLFGDPYLVLGQEPGLVGAPASPFTVPVAFSTLRETRIDRVTFRIRSRDDSREVQTWEVAGDLCGPGVTPLESATGSFPEGRGIHVLEAEAWSSGAVVARNALYLVSDGGDPLPETGHLFLNPWNTWVEGVGGCMASACWCEGFCAIHFSLWDLGGIRERSGRFRLTGEFSAYDPRMSQTGSKDLEGARMEAWWNGQRVATGDLPPARNDHRGVLSWIHAASTLKGAYGEVQTLDLGSQTIQEGGDLALKGTGGGLMVFFSRGGRHLLPLEVSSVAP
ncbi:MAG TPA: glycoside hydrolase family 2 TIM barrel-domain containing protein [Myxococcota bacterium]|nr:glycoside hydrolase family 2 TIM barrel-domain containing protein [Myxococcota bacterium]HQK51766.1 glycoside hydrolase family 2 TIM barrel-domain containing protein [Myxococcota bacterium]